MDAIVAVYEDWGIGRDGTQPLALTADRKFFRKMTTGACVIAGRRTVEDFPGKKPLPGRTNLMLTRSGSAPEGFELVSSVEEAVERAKEFGTVFIIGGGSVYKAMLPYCDRCIVTKVHANPGSDTYFENLDEHPDWCLTQVLESGEEGGIAYEFCVYERG